MFRPEGAAQAEYFERVRRQWFFEGAIWLGTVVLLGALPGCFHLFVAHKNNLVSDFHAFWGMPEGWIYSIILSGALMQEACVDHEGQGVWRAVVLSLCPVVIAVSSFGYAILAGTADAERNLNGLANDWLAQPQFYVILAMLGVSMAYMAPLKLAKCMAKAGPIPK